MTAPVQVLCRFSDAGKTCSPRAHAAGVRKAPRHEIAVCRAPGVAASAMGIWAGRACPCDLMAAVRMIALGQKIAESTLNARPVRCASGFGVGLRAGVAPSAAVRQFSIAAITLSWPRLTWPALAWCHAGPWPRKISANSNAGRGKAWAAMPAAGLSVTSRTAVYGPVRTVVWEGWSREAPPYPDHCANSAVAVAPPLRRQSEDKAPSSKLKEAARAKAKGEYAGRCRPSSIDEAQVREIESPGPRRHRHRPGTPHRPGERLSGIGSDQSKEGASARQIQRRSP